MMCSVAPRETLPRSPIGAKTFGGIVISGEYIPHIVLIWRLRTTQARIRAYIAGLVDFLLNNPMRLVAAPLGLLLALVIAVLAVPQVVTMEATLRPLTSGGLQSLIDRFDLLLLIVVAMIGLGLIVAFASQIKGR